MNTKRNRKKEGFLQVKLSSRSALGKAWKRKWVVVQQNTSSKGKSLLLELYMEKGAYHKTVTSLLLEDVVSVRRTKSKTQEHAIEISSASKTLLTVSADSETETQDWLNMFQANLLPPVKELPCPPGIPNDFMRLSVIPGKDTERLKLEGDYYAHISLASINLYDPCTGDVALEWDLRHLKKFMLISKCHPLDEEKIVHILPSKRSPKGEGEFIFFSAKGKQLVESIYERLSNAMTVKSRRSRSTSMLFEITPQELEQMFKEPEQPVDDKIQETEEDTESTSEKEGEVNGEEPGQNGDAKDDVETEKVESNTEAGVDNEVNKDETADTTRQEEDTAGNINDESGHAKELDMDVQENGKASPELEETTPPVENAVEQPDSAAADTQDAGAVPSDDQSKDAESEEVKDADDDKSNQTYPEEMDQFTKEVSPDSDLNIEEAKLNSEPDGSTNHVTPDSNQEISPGVMTDESRVHVESPETNGEIVISTSVDQSTTFQEPSNQDETTSTEPSKQEETTSQEPPNQEDTTSQEPPNQEETTSQEPPNQEYTTSQEPPNQDVSATSQEPPNQEETTSQEPPNQEDTTSQEPPNQDVGATSQEPPNQEDTTSQEPPNQDVSATSQEPPNQEDTTSQEPPNQEDTTSQEPPNQDVSATSQEPPNQEDTTSQELPNQEDTTSQETPNQDVGETSQEPPNQEDTTSQEPPNQEETTSQEPPNQEETTSQEPPSQEDATSPEPSQQFDTPTEPKQSNTHEGDSDKTPESNYCPPEAADQSASEVNTATDMEQKQEQDDPAPISEADLQPDPAMSEASTEPHKSLDSTPDGADANASVESTKPSDPESALSENCVDDSNPNVNNSNSNGCGRQPGNALPLPNILTSRMAEALKNAQRRRLSTDKTSPTKETQTEFTSSDCQDTDQTSEIIV